MGLGVACYCESGFGISVTFSFSGRVLEWKMPPQALCLRLRSLLGVWSPPSCGRRLCGNCVNRVERWSVRTETP